MRKNDMSPGCLSGIVFGVVAIVASIVIFSWRDVDPGYLGIRFNRISGEITVARLTPGNYFINPFTESTVVYPVRTRQLTLSTEPAQGTNNTVVVRDKQSQRLGIDTVINYHVNEKELGELYRKYGGRSVEDLEATVLRQAINTSVGKVTSTRGWEEANLKKEALAADVYADLAPKFADVYMVLESVQVPDVELSQELEALIAAKTNRLQENANLQAERDNANVVNQKAIDLAKANAEIQRTQAQANADAVVTNAKAQAEANELLTRSLSPALIEYRKIDKWDGKLPSVTGADGTIVSTGSLTDTLR